jgi:hypothetical protein
MEPPPAGNRAIVLQAQVAAWRSYLSELKVMIRWENKILRRSHLELLTRAFVAPRPRRCGLRERRPMGSSTSDLAQRLACSLFFRSHRVAACSEPWYASGLVGLFTAVTDRFGLHQEARAFVERARGLSLPCEPHPDHDSVFGACCPPLPTFPAVAVATLPDDAVAGMRDHYLRLNCTPKKLHEVPLPVLRV